ncbi:MAG: efflux RND transporter permease subunit [Mucilaginibacter polytrichastri]|nr:efflux RND transporter permease subunit [Mucilaginibacter polytrichastri]
MKDIEKEFKVSSWAIDNKTAVYVLTLIISIMGIISYNTLPKENFPEIQIPKIFIQTIYQGTSPANMETLVTRQIEKQLKSTQGLKKLTSNSYQDYSFITAEFDIDVDIKEAKRRVQDAVDKAKSDLPPIDQRFKEPDVIDVNLSDLPILYVNLSGNYSLKKLKEYADDIQERIESFPEVSKVDIVGALDREIQINVDMYKMNAAGITFGDIINTVGNENITSSGGTVPIDGVRRTLNVKMDFKSADELSRMVIRNSAGRAVYLSDIADVTDGFKTQESFARLYGKNVITLNVTKRSGENLIEASDKIRGLMEEMKGKELPKGLDITLTGDQSDQTRVTLHDLINTIIIGFVLVTVILMFFMGVTNAIFVALSVPISCFLAFLAMPALGGMMGFNFTMNMIVLFSFLLALGIVVDDAIVVIENTHRIFENGKVPIKKAAKIAAGEVFLPVLSGTMTTLAPFVPLMFWNSIIGKFMFFLPLTLIVTLVASLIVAYVINPVFAVQFMKPHVEHEHGRPTFDRHTRRVTIGFAIMAGFFYLITIFGGGKGTFGVANFVTLIGLLYLLYHFYLEGVVERFQKNGWPAFQDWYAKRLEWFLHRPWQTLIGTIVLLFLTIGFLIVRSPKVEFFPSSDPNFIYVYIQLPVGTDQAYTNKVTKQVEDRVTKAVGGRDNKIVSSIISNVTVGVTDPQDEDQGNYPNKGKVSVAFVEFGKRNGADTKEYLGKVRSAVQGIPGAQISVTQEQSGPPTAKPISIEITGDDLDTLVKTSERLRAFLVKRNIGGVEELRSDFQNNKPEILFDVDREKADRAGFTSSTISNAIGAAVYGAEVSKFRDAKEDYPIMLRAKEEQRDDIEALRNMQIGNAAGAKAPISSFANIDYVNTYGGIKRKQQKRIIILSSNVLSDYNPNEVVANVQGEINNFRTPEGITIRMGGEQEEQAEAAIFLVTALGVALGLIILILIIQFNSIGKTVIILSEIFFSIIGVFLGVSIFGMTISVVMTGVGIIALAGVVVRNGILLVEFSDLMIEQGMKPFEACLEAGRTRMTPVILTAIAAILGLIPLAVGLNIDFTTLFTEFNPHIFFGGDNVAFWGPLSWTMIFGLSFGTFLTLILVPCMYLIRIRLKGGCDEKVPVKKAEPELNAI